MDAKKRMFLGAGIAALLVVGGATAANAGTSYVNYSAVMPKFQQSTYLPFQTKASATANSELKIFSIGGSSGQYQVNAKGEDGAGRQGAEAINLNPGGPIALGWAGGRASGTVARVVLTNSSYTVVDVVASVAWRSN